jgi:branched-chain amino acid transport system ATP-binding protein
MTAPALAIKGLSKRFGGLPAITDISLTVQEGERRLILGPNGAGKTTLFNLISGDLRCDTGSIRVGQTDVSRMGTALRAKLGVGRTYQILTLFDRNTLLGNVAMAVLGTSGRRWHPLLAFRQDDEFHRKAAEYLCLVGLEALADKPLSTCSYGEKRRLELAMALAQDPKLLLLDEPLAGLSQPERRQVTALLSRIPRHVSIVMIEHDMEAALTFAERVSVLHHGRLIVDGTREDVVSDPRTREVYLGH